MQRIVAEVVGGGLSEWPSGSGPRGETIAPCAFVDAARAPGLLELPATFRADPEAWRAIGRWQSAPEGQRRLEVEVQATATISITLVFAHRRMAPFLAAIERAGCFYLCPTTAQRGVNARLARDESVPVDLEPSAIST